MAVVTRSSERKRAEKRRPFKERIATLPAAQRKVAVQQQQEAERRAEALAAAPSTEEAAKGLVPQAEEQIIAQAEVSAEIAGQTEEVKAQIAQARAEWEAEKAKWEAELANYVKLDHGEYMLKTDYETLSAEDQKLISSIGIDAYNTQKQTQFENNNVKIEYEAPAGVGGTTTETKVEWIPKDVWLSLGTEIMGIIGGDPSDPSTWSEDQKMLMKLGVEGFNKWKVSQAEARLAPIAAWKNEDDTYDLDAAVKFCIWGDPTRVDNTELRATLISIFGEEAVQNADTRVRAQRAIEAYGGPAEYIRAGAPAETLLKAGYEWDYVNSLWQLQTYWKPAPGVPTGYITEIRNVEGVLVPAPPQGHYDLPAALAGGVSPELIQNTLGITDTQLTALQKIAEAGSVDEYMATGGSQQTVIDAGYTFTSPDRTLPSTASDMTGWIHPVTGQPLTASQAESYIKLGNMDIATATSEQKINAQDLVNIGVFDNLETAQLYFDAQRTMRGRTIEEAIATGRLSKEQLLLVGLMDPKTGQPLTPEQISEYYDKTVRMQNALAAIASPMYRNDDGTYNLEAIIYDKVLSPGDLVLLFGSEDQAEQDVLIEIIRNVGEQKIKDLGKQYRAVPLRAASIARTYLDWTVPGYGTVRHWSEMPGWQKGVSIGADILFVLPMLGAVGKIGLAAREAAMVSGRIVKPVSVLSRISNVAKTGTVMMEQTAQGGIRLVGGAVKAPFKLVISPVSTTKGLASGAKQMAEIAVFPIRHPIDTAKGLTYVLSGQEAMGKSIFTKLISLEKVAVPVEEGEAIVWKGLAVGERPVVGKSGRKITFGKGEIEYPKASRIPAKARYEPHSMLETRIMADPKALAKMGFSPKEISYLQETLATRQAFAGRLSPFTSPEAEFTPIKYLDEKAVNSVLDETITAGAKVERIYGSGALRQQLDPKLRSWREIHDMDIQTRMSQEEAESWAKKLANRIAGSMGKENVRISPESGTLIETRDAVGNWHHAVDIHSISPDAATLAIGSESMLDVKTTYGMKHPEPAIEIVYPGKGKLRIMRLSEIGKDKAGTILEWHGGQPGKYEELGIIGRYTSDADAIDAVATQGKPIAEIIDTPTNRLAARLKGLEVTVHPNDPQFIHVTKKGPNVQKIIDRLLRAESIDITDPTSQLVRDVEMGKAFGYSDTDIARFLNERYSSSLLQQIAPQYYDPSFSGPFFAPPEHRGKDYLDYYVIVRTFLGEEAASQWALKAGFDPAKMAAMADSVPGGWTWEFVKAPVGESLSVASQSPRLAITAPSYIQAISPTDVSASTYGSVVVSPSIPSPVGYVASPVPSAPSPAASIPSPYVSTPIVGVSTPAPSAPAPYSPTPSVITSIPYTPSPYAPSPYEPSPYAPSPYTSPPYAPPPYPSPYVPPPYPHSPVLTDFPPPTTKYPPFILPPNSSKESLTQEELAASVTWRQGLFWILRYPPYRLPEDLVYLKAPPEGVGHIADGPDSAYKTIQKITEGAVGRMQPYIMGFQRVGVEEGYLEGEGKGPIKFELIPEKAVKKKKPKKKRGRPRKKKSKKTPSMEGMR